MLIAIYDDTDPLFAHLVLSVARRRGHTARTVMQLGHIRNVFPSDPDGIVIGVAHVDQHVVEQIGRVRERQPDAYILVVAEDANAAATISALEQGASDLLRKPVLPRELIIRIERGHPTQDRRTEGAVRVADLEVDLERVRAAKAGHELVLTRTEFRLLYCLMQHFGRVTPVERLMTFGADEEMAASSLKTHISHLRQKLRDAGGASLSITARQMLGYVLEESDVPAATAGPAAESR